MKKIGCWKLFLCMSYAQLAYRYSLKDIELIDS